MRGGEMKCVNDEEGEEGGSEGEEAVEELEGHGIGI